MSDTPDTNTLLDRVDAAMKLIEITRRERDEATTKLQRISSELQMWRDGNILHENHRDELEKAERERDEAIKEMNRYKRQWEESRMENVEDAK
jgi:hypothetical protein